ncbi:hypothetical protein ABT024_05045 [Streptomyces sp. NPDC002812]|uniref:hypothetical protein n=1 Tax=Streptomyces sp. NPDC002812 TaxID=3154434 RepID=UPI00332154D6
MSSTDQDKTVNAAEAAENEAEAAETEAVELSVYDKIAIDADAEVSDELSAITRDPFARRARAEEIRDQARMELMALKPERDQLIAAAALYEPRDHLHQLFGISSLSMRRCMRSALGLGSDRDTAAPLPKDRAAAARAAGLLHSPDLVQRAIAVCERYEAAEARRRTAVAWRDEAHEATLTAGGRVKVAPLERPDFESVRQAAVNEINAQFATLVAGPEERLHLASEAVDQAEEEMSLLRIDRDQAVNTLAFYTTARGIDFSVGINREGVRVVQRRALGLPRHAKLPPKPKQPAAARRAGVRFMADAGEDLPQIALAYEAAKARRSAAIEIRDAAMRTLHSEPYNWTQVRLSEFTGRSVGVINAIVRKPTKTSSPKV